MLDTTIRWIKQITELAFVVVALGVILQILFPGALVFINADVAGNLIGLNYDDEATTERLTLGGANSTNKDHLLILYW